MPHPNNQTRNAMLNIDKLNKYKQQNLHFFFKGHMVATFKKGSIGINFKISKMTSPLLYKTIRVTALYKVELFWRHPYTEG